MLLQMKVYLISILYFFSGLFFVIFPPRNFERSGHKYRNMKTSSGKLVYQQYLNYETVVSESSHLAESNPELVRMEYLSPCTANNRTIISLELRSDKESKKPGIFIIGGINAMSWGAANVVLELANKLVYDASYQTPFFNDYDWYLIPIGNPDGVAFTQGLLQKRPLDVREWSRNETVMNHTRPDYWYKNTGAGQKPGLCTGTNINRNFAYHWQDDVPKTPDECSQFYPGAKPFTTNEAQAIRTYIDRLGEDVNMAIHLHSSFTPKKEYILYPWRYSVRQPSNYRTLQDVGEYAARQSRLPDGRLFEVHQSSNDVRVAGTLTDYVTGVVGVELAFLIKPFHELYPNITDPISLETYVKKATSAILGLVRGWRSSTKQNTLSFFGRDVEF